MAQFWIKSRLLDNKRRIIVVDMKGWVDISSSMQFEEHINSLVKTGKENIIMDLSQMEYINTRGLGAFVALQKKMDERGGSVVLAAPTERVKQSIELTGINRVIATYESLEDALQNYQGQ
jgi:anti-sigma B factor antagonist